MYRRQQCRAVDEALIRKERRKKPSPISTDMKYEIAIFDLDGTILNTIADLADSTNYALAKVGFPQRTISEVNSFVGNGIHKLIERAVPKDTSENDTEAVYREFLNYYANHCDIKTKPYSGITQLLKNLQAAGCKTAVVSNKADFAVKKLCNRYFDGMFDIAMGEKQGIPRKPAPDAVEYVLTQLNVSRKKAVYIGDSEVDIQTAENAGTDCIIVSWGFRNKEFLREKGAKNIVDYAEELERIILEI